VCVLISVLSQCLLCQQLSQAVSACYIIAVKGIPGLPFALFLSFYRDLENLKEIKIVICKSVFTKIIICCAFPFFDARFRFSPTTS